MSAVAKPYKKFTLDELREVLTAVPIRVKDPTRTLYIHTGSEGAKMIDAALREEARRLSIKMSLDTLRCRRAITPEERLQFETMLTCKDQDSFDLAEALIETKMKTLL